MLRVFRSLPPPESGSEIHDVLAFAGGPLQREYTIEASRVTVTPVPHELQALLARDYDVVHVLFERGAHRLAPLVLAMSDAAFVYGKNYDVSAMFRMHAQFDWSADESVLSASDAVTFTTLDLAAGYRLPPGRTTILRKAAFVTRAMDVPRLVESSPPRLLCVANLHPRKRLADLLAVMHQVRARVPAATLRIVGGGTPAQVADLTTRIDAAHLTDAIQLTGPQDAIERELAECRVFVLPSGAEGVPTVILEAMAAARPVVATRVGHIGHILTDGCEGYLTPPGDVTMMAARIVSLLEQPRQAARMGAAGRVRAAAHDVRAVAQDLLRVLRRTATARRRAA